MKYKVYNYVNEGRVYKIGSGEAIHLGTIEADDRRFIIYETNDGRRYIEEMINVSGDSLKPGDWLAVAYIEEEELWKKLLFIAKKEGIIP
jgi:hypothetical protein